MNQTIKIKRTLTPDNPPASLAEGELSLGLGDVPVRMWAGTPRGVEELFVGAAVEDAEDDSVYGRCNGDWVPVPIVDPDLPVDPAPNSLWYNSAEGALYLWYDDGDSAQWIGVASGGRPQGPIVSATPPADPTRNMLWIDSTDMRLYIYFNAQWVETNARA